MPRELHAVDRDAMLAYAYGNERENIFLISHLEEHEPFVANRYVGLERQGKLAGVAAFFGCYGSLAVHGQDPSVIRALVDAMMDVHVRVESVPAFLRHAEPTVERLRHHGLLPKRQEPSLVLSVHPATFRRVETRAERARSNDIDALVFLDRTLHGVAGGPVTELERQRTGWDRMFVLREGGKVVSKALLHGRTRHVGQIGGVVTYPDFRRRGYGRQCVSALCTHWFSQGVEEMILFTAETNHPAQALYRSLGFGEIDKYLLTEYAL